MADALTTQLSRRERQIMDVVYRNGRVTAAEVLAELPEPPGYLNTYSYIPNFANKIWKN